MQYTSIDFVKQTLKPRSTDAHKGNFGKVLIYAGSIGMAGAAIFNGKAALKAGAGLVQFLLTDLNSPLLTILQIAVPEATCVDLSALDHLDQYNAISAGSGLGTGELQQKLLSRILKTYQGTLVLDADALNMLSASQKLSEEAKASGASLILTPHVGEAKRLLHTCAGIAGLQLRKQAVSDLANAYHGIAVLKGSGTLINDWKQPREIYQNTSGNPGMATAGSGDCLAGLIASLAAQGYSPLDAARMGVYLHGRAGDLAAEKLGEAGLTASDILAAIPYAFHLNE